MIIKLPDTTTKAVTKKLTSLSKEGVVIDGARVLTLVVCTEENQTDPDIVEYAIETSAKAAKQHPCRIIVVVRGSNKEESRLDASIRFGGDAGVSEIVVLKLYGPLSDHSDSVVVPFLLPDTPVVAWWPGNAPDNPSEDLIGKLAIRRITDSSQTEHTRETLEQRRTNYAPGDSDLEWSRITYTRALLTSALDQPPFEKLTGVTINGPKDSAALSLFAGWIAAKANVEVRVKESSKKTDAVSIVLERGSSPIKVEYNSTSINILQAGQPAGKVSLIPQSSADTLSQELRRLNADEVYKLALSGIPKLQFT